MTTKKTGKRPLSRSLRVYQKIAIAFVIVSFILLLFVLYLSISSATIRITPVDQAVSSNLSVEVVQGALQEGQIDGSIAYADFTKAETFFLPEEGAMPVEGKAGGMVTLINETASDQPLIATTRLMSEEGVLFRIDESVVVPANDQIDVMVHADEEGVTGEVGPTQFTIPGLASSLQELIYAVSVDSMGGGVEYIRILQNDDLEGAVMSLQEEILIGAEEQLAEMGNDEEYDSVVYLIEEVERVTDTEVGAEVGSFNASLSLSVTAVYYDGESLRTFAVNDLQSRISENFVLASVSDGADEIQVDVRSADIDNAEAALNIHIEGVSVISPSSEVLDKDRLIGRSSSDVEVILEASELIESVSVSYTPFWLKRVPTLKDHIKIVVE